MKIHATTKDGTAFTVLELMVSIGILGFIMILLLPQHHGKQSAVRINCVNNLKQIGMSFRIWAGDHNDLLPMEYKQDEGWAPRLGDGTSLARCFQILANELGSAKVLWCPADKERTAATNFITDLNNTHISYFLGWDAGGTNVAAILSGDRNVTNGMPMVNGTLALTTNHPSGWTAEIHNRNGNVVLGDGSVQQLSGSRLRDAVRVSGVATNRLAFP